MHGGAGNRVDPRGIGAEFPIRQPAHDARHAGAVRRFDGRGIFFRAVADRIGNTIALIEGDQHWTFQQIYNDARADYDTDGTYRAMGRVLFTDYLVPFELSSALLMIAIVAAVAVARGKHASDNPHNQGPVVKS